MKKKYIVAIILIILLIVGAIFGYGIFKDNERKYELVKVEKYNYFVLKQESGTGVINRDGKVIIEAKYDEVKIPNPEKAIFICVIDDNKTKVLNEKNEEILTNFNNVDAIRLKNLASDLMYEKSVLKYEEDGKYGIVDFDGNVITKAIYEELGNLPYREGEILAKHDGKYGVININGKELIEQKFETVASDGYYTNDEKYNYSGYIVSIKTDEGYRYGYINYKGKQTVKEENNELERINEIKDNNNVYLITAKNGQYGVIKNTDEFIKNEYQSVRYDSNNKVFVVEKSKKYGIVNMEGKLIVPVQYNQIDITGIYLYAQNEQGTTVFNGNGTQANIDSNVSILNTSNEKYRIRINNQIGTKYGVINKEGTLIIDEKYSYMEYLYENYFIVGMENGKLGVVNDKDEEKIKIENDSLQKIQDTDLIQTTNSSTGMTTIYSKNMEKLCELESGIVAMQNEYIMIYNQIDESVYLSKDGKIMKNIDVYPNNKIYASKKDDKWGFVNKDGKVVVEYKYDRATEVNEFGYASVKLDDKWGSIDSEGKVIIEPTYELKDEIDPIFIGKYYQFKLAIGEIYYTDQK